MLNHLVYKLGISISPSTEIGSGFYIGHFGGIVINGKSVIGKNCNISQGVTLGQANRGKNIGYPTLGDNIYIGPGAKIVGAVKIGNNVAIGANCVVTKDIPDNSVVVGVPGKVISQEGSIGYVNKIDYDNWIS
jgi:serine O-acetyltransferase